MAELNPQSRVGRLFNITASADMNSRSIKEALIDPNDTNKVNSITKILARYGYELVTINNGAIQCKPQVALEEKNPIYISGIDAQGRVIFDGLNIIGHVFSGLDAIMLSQCMVRCSDMVKDLADINVVILR